jgi:hypothetical protein
MILKQPTTISTQVGCRSRTPLVEAESHTVSRFSTKGEEYNDKPNFKLPPLDALMIWHSYMLNPRIYLDDSVRYTKHTLWRTSFPWKLIYKSIDDERWTTALEAHSALSRAQDVFGMRFKTTVWRWSNVQNAAKRMRLPGRSHLSCLDQRLWASILQTTRRLQDSSLNTAVFRVASSLPTRNSELASSAMMHMI